MKYFLGGLVVALLLSLSVNPVFAAKKAPVKTPTKMSFSCSVRKTVCAQMRSCDEAKFYLKACGVKKLDGDRDGIPCEVICKK